MNLSNLDWLAIWQTVGSWTAYFLSFIAAAGLLVKLLPGFVGEKLLGFALDKKLAAFKASQDAVLAEQSYEHNKQIESLKASLDNFRDRASHSNRNEYESLSVIWRKCVELYNATNIFLGGTFLSVDLNNLPPDKLIQYLELAKLTEPQMELMHNAKNKNDAYGRIVMSNYAESASTQYHDLRILILESTVFIPRNITEEFNRFAELAVKAILQKRMEIVNLPDDSAKAIERYVDSRDQLLEDLASTVRTRLLAS